ncbi:hypothetical protein [Mesorhizobium sp. SP-1A]|uniref:hypothetical protein n=1 Tax=Mesorhizobium sp. SP-1A TaxID=3077840 RepID=UPI0028F729ED|nr:hypothetical protein [Mesorhizobium sp. SP-1A]
MALSALPSEILAENLLKCGAITAQPGDPDFDKSKVGADTVLDQSEKIETAIVQFGQLDWLSDATPMSLEMGLRHVLSLRPKTAEVPGWNPLTQREHERLLSAIYGGLGDAIGALGDRIPVEQLQTGMLAAAMVVDDLRSGSIDNDRHRDAAARAKILIYYAQICQYEDDIEKRRRERERATVGKMLAPAKPTEDELFR